MKVTRKWLESKKACSDGKEWYLANCDPDPIIGVRQLLDGGHFDWANWLLVRIFTKQENVRYAVYAASQVLEMYEIKHPGDKRPRKAIAAARKYLKEPTAANRDAANAAASAAAYAAERAAAYAANAAGDEMKRKIILYGIRILREEEA